MITIAHTTQTSLQHRWSWLQKSHWLAALALLGVILLAGGSLSWAATTMASAADEKLLAGILQQLEEQEKKVKSSAVLSVGGQTEVLVMLMDGGVKRYDNQGRLKYEKDANGKTTLYEEGMPVEERDGRGNLISKTTYERGSSGEMRKMIKTGKNGIEVKIADAKGNIIQMTNQQGTRVFTNYVKNAQGKVLSYVETDLNSGKRSQIFLNPTTGEVVSKVDQNGVRTEIENFKDKAGQLVRSVEKDSAGNVTVKRYEQGQLVEEDKNGVRTTYENVVSEKGGLAQVTETKYTPTEGGMHVEKTVKIFDDAGRVSKMKDKDGEHEFTYELTPEGRMAGRREVVYGPDGKLSRNIYERYDEAGRVIVKKENGKDSQTTYVLDEKGNVRMAIETITHDFGGKTYTETLRKEYDSQNREIARTDQFGTRTEYSYDGQGNRRQSKSEFETTDYTYDRYNNLVASVTQDHKSTTYTTYDERTKLAERKVKVMNSGALQITEYALNGDGKRVSYEYGPYGVKVTVYRSATSDQPENMVYYKYNGKVITTTYEYAGEGLVASKEVGPTGEVVTLYNGFQKPQHSERVDQFGRKSITDYEYKNGRMASSLMVDEKGKTTTEFNKYEDPARVIRENVIGFPRKSIEERQYTNGMLTTSVTTDFRGKSITEYDANETATVVHRVNHHGFPRENFVTNIYDEGGDVIETVQLDKRGTTHNWMDKDGLQQKSVRVDLHGFPREKTTTYKYEKGELVTSDMVDERGRTHNTFDKDGLMRTSHRVKLFGFPREEKTKYEYDENGFMVWSMEDDENGTTESWYNIDEVVDTSLRRNLYGHAREQWTKYLYDGDGYMTVSKENDLRGVTVTNYDIDSLATDSMRYDKYGVQYSRDTLTLNDYNEKGFLTVSYSKNLMGSTEKTVDLDNLTRRLVQDDNFGVNWSRHKVTEGYEYDDHGRMQKSIERDTLGTTVSKYDIHGDAIWTERFAVTGLNLTRDTITETTYKDDTGMTTHSISKNAYGVTENLEYDPITGLSAKQISDVNFGLTGSRHTVTAMDMDKRHGLTRETKAQNDLGETHTVFDTVTDGRHGVATWSEAKNKYGLGYTRINVTKIQVNRDNGLNTSTLSVAKGANGALYSTTATDFDDKEYGVAVHSLANNEFGLMWTRANETEITTNKDNGLNQRTDAVARGQADGQVYSRTTTYYDDKDYGVATSSLAENMFGLGLTRINESKIQVNTFNGLNQVTEAVAKGKNNGAVFSFTRTIYDDQHYGVATSSLAENSFGLSLTRVNETEITANTNNGLNQQTESVARGKDGTQFSLTVTNYDDAHYGVAKSSRTDNRYGLGATLHSEIKEGNMQVNINNGLNISTLSESAYGKTKTDYDDQSYGVAVSSVTDNNFGLGATRHSEIKNGDLKVNTDNGLNISTLSVSAYGTTYTLFDDEEFGVSVASVTDNNFGLGATRHSEIKNGDLKVNTNNGLNISTVSVSEYGTTQTQYDDKTFGVALSSVTDNNFGLGATRHSEIKNGDMVVNTYNGLNISTVAVTEYGTTRTQYDDEAYGVAVSSVTDNNFGLGATQHSEIKQGDMKVNNYNGLNISTLSESAYGTTFTEYDQDHYGVATNSDTKNNFGLGATRHSWISKGNMRVNTHNGLNISTLSESAYGKTYTEYDEDEFGVATNSVTDNNFGLGATRHSEIGKGNMVVNTQNGLNIRTLSVSAYGQTETVYDDKTYGVATSSVTDNNFGLGATRHSEVKPGNMQVNTYNGLNISTVSESAYGVTRTEYDQDHYGVAVSSDTTNHYGLGATRHNWIGKGNMVVNTYNGLNISTLSESAYGKTFTEYDQDQYGVATNSVTDNNFGLGATLHSEIKKGDMKVNTYNGLNISTFSVSQYGTTLTEYDQDHYGVATNSDTNNNFGLGATRHSWIGKGHMKVNTFNGMNISTLSESAYGKTYTAYDQDQYGVAVSSVTDNNFGLGATLHSEVAKGDMRVNTYNGLNISTRSVSDYGTTLTRYDDGKFGVATSSVTDNNFGLLATRHSEIGEGNMVVNTFNGLNIKTISQSDYGTTMTEYDQHQYGVATNSVSDNIFGLGATLHSVIAKGDMVVNTYNGLNISTRSVNAYGTTRTNYDQHQTGVATDSDTLNNFGLGATRHSWIAKGNMLVNTYNGLNISTLSESAYGKTFTRYDDKHCGVAVSSVTDNVFGLRATLHSEIGSRDMEVNVYNGLNIRTLSVSKYGKTETWYDDKKTGVAVGSDTNNNFGLIATRHNWIARGNMKVNTYNGLNISTLSESEYGTTYTEYDQHASGVATNSDTHNKFGLGATRHSWIAKGDMKVNTYNGLNISTLSVSAYGKTFTTYDQQQTGVATSTVTDNNFGLGATLHSEVSPADMKVNTFNGLNIHTRSVSLYGVTITNYEQDHYGIATDSDTKVHYGLMYSRHSWISKGNMKVNIYNGLNISTKSESDYGTTLTRYDQDQYGVATSSVTDNKFGLGATLHSVIGEGDMVVNTFNGLNTSTRSVSAYGTTLTKYDDAKWGVAKTSVTDNNYGLVAARHSVIAEGDLRVNTFNGLNVSTKSSSAYGTTFTEFDDKSFGIAECSQTTNNFGLGATLYSQIRRGNMRVNVSNGLNISTFSESAYGTTLTNYDQDHTGVALDSDTNNNYGLGFTRHSWIRRGNLKVNTYNGLNIKTISESQYGTTTTRFDDQAFGVAIANRSVNHYGIGAARTSWSDPGEMVVDVYTGLNIQTLTHNDYCDTLTFYKNRTSGVAKSSETWNKKGVEAARHSVVAEGDLRVNEYTGVNISSRSVSAYGATLTRFDPDYGTVRSSETWNNYGVGCTRHSWISAGANCQVNKDTGLNIYTKSQNDAGGWTASTFSSDSYATVESTVAYSPFGAPAGRTTNTTYTVDKYWGVNTYTRAVTGMGYTDTWYELEHGTATSSVNHNNNGPTGSRVTTSEIKASTWSGLNTWSKAVNALSTTITDRFDPEYGTAQHQITNNVYGVNGSKQAETIIEADLYTGMNKRTFTQTRLSNTWTNYNTTTGAQTTSLVQMGSWFTLGYAIWTQNTFETYDTNIMKKSTASNMMGLTETNYDKDGLATSSDNWSAYGLALYTHTEIHTNSYTGILSWNKASSYSRGPHQMAPVYETKYVWVEGHYEYPEGYDQYYSYDGGYYGDGYGTWVEGHYEAVQELVGYQDVGPYKLSDSYNYANTDGVIVATDTTNTYGATKGRQSHTDVLAYNQENGNKIKTKSSSSLGYSVSDYNAKGVEMHTVSHSELGPTSGRDSTTDTMTYDENTGIRRSSYTSSALNKSKTYYDQNGLPDNAGYASIKIDSWGSWSGGVYQEKQNTYAGGDGDKYELTSVSGDVYWSGHPSQLITVTHIGSTTVNQDENGFATSSVSTRVYAANGSQYTTTTNTTDTATGMTKQSHTVRCNGQGSSIQHYNTDYGTVEKTQDWDKSGKASVTTQENYNDTGMMRSSKTTADGYTNVGTCSDRTRGWTDWSKTWQDYKDGKKRKTKVYESTFRFNAWTGLRTYEHRTYLANRQSGDKTEIYYDDHGVENKQITADHDYPDGEAQQVTQWYGQDENNNPTSMVTTVGDIRRETAVSMQVMNINGNNSYFPTETRVELFQSEYVKVQNVSYTLGENGPVAATARDEKGTEVWAMDNSYYNSGMTSRKRVNYDGSSISWTYTDVVTDGLYHQEANISYTTLWGVANGSGTETYTVTGIPTSRSLNNTNAMNERITFENDGQYVTSGTGQREDGQEVSYTMAGANEIATSVDDKGVTTWDRSTNLRQSTEGEHGTFTWVYNGGTLTEIHGESDKGTTRYQSDFKTLLEWTDEDGVKHTYSGTAFNSKGYCTQATENFTDGNGAKWSGTANYDAWGFYYAGGELAATNANLNTQGAANTIEMDKAMVAEAVQDFLKDTRKQKETWTWKAPSDDRGQKTNGELKAEALTEAAIKGFADVKLTINPDGSYSADLTNAKYDEIGLEQKARFKPTSSTSSTSSLGTPLAEENFWQDANAVSRYNDPFYKGFIGRVVTKTGEAQEEVGSHTETHTTTVTETDKDGKTITKEVEVSETVIDYATRYYYSVETYTKVDDGWQWVATGGTSEEQCTDVITQSGAGLVSDPVGKKRSSRRIAAASVRTNYTGAPAQGVTLGSYTPASAATTAAKVDPTAASQSETGAEVKVAAASVATESEDPAQVTAASVTTTQAGKPAPAAETTKDAVVAKFRAIQTLQDAAEFVKLVMSQFGREGILAGLEDSGAANLMKALATAYKMVFGEGYQRSLLGKLLTLATDNQAVFEEVRIAIQGGEVMSGELKLAAKIARQVQDAKSVIRNEEGLVVEAVEKSGVVTKFAYDDSGLTETILATDGGTTVLHYDENGQLLSESAGGRSKTYAYLVEGENAGNVSVTERTAEGVSVMMYDNQGRLVGADKNGQKMTITYLNSGSYSAKIYAANGSLQEERSYQQGRLAKVKRADGSTVKNDYLTDGSGKVLALTQSIEDKDGQKTILKYNSEGRLVSALGKDANRIQKTIESGDIAEEAFGFEIGKEMFGDPRMDGMRIDQKKLHMGLGQQE